MVKNLISVCKLSPQSSLRRSSFAPTMNSQPNLIKNQKYLINNKHQQYQLNRRNSSLKTYENFSSPALTSLRQQQRRMSSIEQTLEKTSSINIHNFENKSSSKIDVDKSTSNINEQQQQQQQQPPSPPPASQTDQQQTSVQQLQSPIFNQHCSEKHGSKIKQLIKRLKPDNFTEEREEYSLYLFSDENK
jgi:voltage-dependent calcium channel T type alpha-1G